MLRDVERQRGLPHRRARGQDEELAAVQPAGHLVQLRKTRSDAAQPRARVQQSVDPALVLIDNLPRANQRGFGAEVADFEQRFLGAREDVLRLVLAQQAAVDQLL